MGDLPTRLGLCLTRRPGQQLLLHAPGLAEPIVITLVASSGQRAKLGILAPLSVQVRRPESPLSRSRKGGAA